MAMVFPYQNEPEELDPGTGSQEAEDIGSFSPEQENPPWGIEADLPPDVEPEEPVESTPEAEGEKMTAGGVWGAPPTFETQEPGDELPIEAAANEEVTGAVEGAAVGARLASDAGMAGQPASSGAAVYISPGGGEGEVKPPPPASAQTREPLSPADERTWAMLAHLSVLANLVTGFLGPVVALAIYLFYKDRSRYVAFHAMQSFIFQLIWWIGGIALIAILWTIVGLLSMILIGMVCIPFALLGTLLLAAMPLVALVYGVVGAVAANQGQPFKYWLVGDWVRKNMM